MDSRTARIWQTAILVLTRFRETKKDRPKQEADVKTDITVDIEDWRRACNRVDRGMLLPHAVGADWSVRKGSTVLDTFMAGSTAKLLDPAVSGLQALSNLPSGFTARAVRPRA